MTTLGNGNGTRLGPVNLQRLAADITAEVERRGGRKVGGEWEFLCPAPEHDDADPSGNWKPDKSGGVWCCRSMGCEKQHGGGKAIDLARLFKFDVDGYREPAEYSARVDPPEIADFARERGLDPAVLADVWGVRAVGGKRPALRYPTDLGVDRLKFLDGAKRKYTWVERGKGHAHWYGMERAIALLRTTGTGPANLYVVNGEPSVWAADSHRVPAVCLACGEGASGAAARLAPELIAAIKELAPPIAVCVVFDVDTPGHTGGPAVAAALARSGLEAHALDLSACEVSLPADGDVGDLAVAVGDRLGSVLAQLPFVPVLPGRADDGEGHEDTTSDGNPDDGKAARVSDTTRLVELVVATGAELFHTPDNESFATVQIDGHGRTLKLSSRQFGLWLSRAFFDSVGRAPGETALRGAAQTLEGRALYEGLAVPVHVRVAGAGSHVYVDLGSPDGRAVELGPDDWKVVDEPPVRFWRPHGTLPLPEPLRGGNVDELWGFLNVAEADRPLVLGWIVFANRPTGPYPVLIFSGEQGSGKSTASRVVRALLDPNMAPIRAEPRDHRDLVIAAANSWALAFDNLSGVHPWLSDALCRLATGGGYATRTNYTNTDETIINVQRPVILNGISDLATRSDLLDRAILINLPRITETSRETESVFWQRFQERLPYILGALLDAFSTALRRMPEVRLPSRPRMADFAEFATAAEPGLGLADGAFIAAYEGNRMVAHETALDGSPVAQVLLAYLDAVGPTGIDAEPGHLLNALDARRGIGRAPQGWQSSPRGRSGILSRLAPNFRAIGIEVAVGEAARRTHGGRRRILVNRIVDATVTTVTNATPQPFQPELRLVAPQPVDDNRHPDEIDRHQPSPLSRDVELNGDHGGGGDGANPVPDLAWVPPDAHLGAAGDLESALP
ncbi:MAG: hypothetical protein IPG72_16150 [Ardenticatenales bacterium]|nr:hypothetical protein [Ardenticatenales bacterium]